MTCVDESGREIVTAGELGVVGTGVVGLDECGAWCWFEVLERAGERALVRERHDWGDPEG